MNHDVARFNCSLSWHTAPPKYNTPSVSVNKNTELFCVETYLVFKWAAHKYLLDRLQSFTCSTQKCSISIQNSPLKITPLPFDLVHTSPL